MTTIEDFKDSTTPYVAHHGFFQVGIYTVRAEVYGNDWKNFSVIKVSSYEPFAVTPEVTLTGDIVFSDEGEIVWEDKIQVEVVGQESVSLASIRYDQPELTAQIRSYLTNLFPKVWTSDIAYSLAWTLRNKMARPFEDDVRKISSKLTVANNKIEEVEKLIASLPELIAARDAIAVIHQQYVDDYRAFEAEYKEKTALIVATPDVKTEIIYPQAVSFSASTKVEEKTEAHAAKKWWQRKK